ncbi:hypothetical protein BDN70DRAFT_771205, partial [Pholiota conissans]
MLAPTTPTIYHGDEDSMKFIKYVTQCKRFCAEAALPPSAQIPRCADYLQGKAYKYYSTMVAMDEDKLTLTGFFQGLYNYCFPPDFHLKQRRKLETLMQGSMTVKEFAAELNLLYRIVGASTPEQRVDRLWNGLHSELQTALWKEGLDYRQSTWDEV